jgi:hypothetical protein
MRLVNASFEIFLRPISGQDSAIDWNEFAFPEISEQPFPVESDRLTND